jgi:phage shock protein A
LAIQDREKQIAQFTEQISKLVAETKRLERERNEASANVDKFKKLATKAAEAGNSDHARQFLEEKSRAESSFNDLKAQTEKNEKLANNLRSQLSKSRAQISDAKSNVTRLEARLSAADVRKDLAKASSDFNAGDNVTSLKALEDAVNKEESEAEAWEEMSGDEAGVSDLAAQYDGASSSEVDDELAKLMSAATKKADKKK